jgi:pimeloyl-ACP methyl ester carboxylesterase
MLWRVNVQDVPCETAHMGRPIQFLDTRWGQVAYSVVGSGRPVLFDTGWVSDLEVMWSHDGYRALVGSLAEKHQVVCFDPPGIGLSERRGSTGSIGDDVAVLSAVRETVGVSAQRRVGLFCSSIAASVAVRFAAQRPDLVDRLALFGAALTGEELASSKARLALLQLVRSHWGLGSRAMADIFVPDAGSADREWFETFQRRSADGETAAARLEVYYASDVALDARRVRAPTVVIHREGDRAVDPRLGAGVAAAIPGATFESVSGSAHLCFLGDWSEVADVVVSFLDENAPATLPRGPHGEFTARETDVAELAMLGLTNAAIGERLGISPRTVETHLSRIRNKLGVNTRAQVAAWMARRAEVR